jgi:hypothetical protein
VPFKHGGGEGFSTGTAKDSLGGKVKEEGVVVIELVQRSALVSSDETKSEVEREREDGEIGRKGGSEGGGGEEKGGRRMGE